MKYVNIGSRWSSKGDSNTKILDIFLRYGVAFFGYENDMSLRSSGLDIKKGDMIVVTDGVIVKAFGKALSDGFELKDHLNKYQFTSNDLSRFNDGQTPSIAVEVALTRIPLPISNKFEYGGQGSRFQNIKNQDCINKINQLYVEYH